MFFKKKSRKNEIKCPECATALDNKKYRFCPYCGNSLMDEAEEMREFGMLGQNDMDEEELMGQMVTNANFTFADKILNTVVQQLIKNLNRQLSNAEKSNPPRIPVSRTTRLP